VQANGQFLRRPPTGLDRFLSRRQGGSLDEVGNVIDSVQNDKNQAWINETRSIMFQVQRQPGTNTVEVVDRVKALIPNLNGSYRRCEAGDGLRPLRFRSAIR